MNHYFPPEYPIDAFPLKVKEAVLDVQRLVQAPGALIAMSFLGAMSIASQRLIDVQFPATGKARPVSLNLLVIAESGERKSTVDSLVCEPIYSHDEHASLAYEIAVKEHQSKHTLWVAIRKGLCRNIVKQTQLGEPVNGLLTDLDAHTSQEPQPPRHRRLIRQNVTERSIFEALRGNGESLAFVSDEGQLILNGGVMRHLGLVNRIWDGAKLLTMDRAGHESLIVQNPRATVSIMVQPAVLNKFVQSHGEIAHGSGHWARYLIGFPPSTKGFRFMWNTKTELPALEGFHDRLRHLLDKSDAHGSSGAGARQLIEFSDEASARWFQLANEAESDLKPGLYMSDISDFASKYMEIVSRVAAILHYFAGMDGKISEDTLMKAVAIMGWHLQEFKRLFSPQHMLSQDQVDTQALSYYLRTRHWKGLGSNSFVPRNQVLRNGPVRPKSRFDIALSNLQATGAIALGQDPAKKIYINLNDHYFNQIAA